MRKIANLPMVAAHIDKYPRESNSDFESVGSIIKRMLDNLLERGDMLSGDYEHPRHG